MTNTITIRKEGKHFICTNNQAFNNINDSWFHHENIQDIKKYYVDKGYKVEIKIN